MPANSSAARASIVTIVDQTAMCQLKGVVHSEKTTITNYAVPLASMKSFSMFQIMD